MTTRYTQDLASPISQVLQTTQGVVTTDYLYGQERLAAAIGAAKTWYLGDALGSVRLTVNDLGLPLTTVNYDPWGTPEAGAQPTTFGFTGELQDVAAGLVNLRARWYGTGQGRFLTRDPFAGDMYQPQSLHIYAYAHNTPINLTDPTGRYACDEGSLNPLRWIDLAGYHGFCGREGTELLTKDQYFTEDQRVNGDSLGTLIYLFDNPNLPGGSGTEASERRRQHLTAAQERLEFILWLTSSGNQVHFAIAFQDGGFNKQFQDREIHPASANQVGHFLTAADLGYNPLVNDYVSLSCIVGHEQSADDSANGGTLTNAKQCAQTTYSDVIQFAHAIVADVNGDYQRRDCIITALVGPNPKARAGNSVQDLRLSAKGWIFGRNIRDGVIRELSQAHQWLVANLR